MDNSKIQLIIYHLNRVNDYIQKSYEITEHTNTRSNDNRNIILLQYMLHTIKNCDATILLINHNLYLPSGCLLRPSLEFILKGLWLGFCCSDLQLEKFYKKGFCYHQEKINGKFKTLTLKELAIEIDDKLPKGSFVMPLQLLVESNNRYFNDRVHGGISMLSKTKKKSVISDFHTTSDILRIIYYQLVLCAMAATTITKTCGDRESTHVLIQKFNEINDGLMDAIEEDNN